VSQAQATLDATTLTAPQAGVVESVNLVVGTLPGSPAVVLRATGFQVLVDVAEQDAPFVRVGQTGQATISALGVTSTVTVVQASISGTQASSTAGASVVSFPVLLSLPSPPPGLLPGMSAQVAWTAASRSSVLAVPTTAIRSGDTGDVVLALVGGRPQAEPVAVGLSTSSLTQVVSGLQAGERVVTGVAG
jgi:macrolide-specific efflux system membrane fusion protein